MLMDKYNTSPPLQLFEEGYRPLRYSFVSFEGFLNAKLLVEILRKMGKNPERSDIKDTVEGIKTSISALLPLYHLVRRNISD